VPKIFEYLGILIFFYSNEHEPIHVHAKKGENESRAELIIEDGVIKEIIIKNTKGAVPLQTNDLKNFKKFLDAYADKVVKKWIDYFIFHKEVKFERIQKKLK
jgi:hypothetical protein